MDSDWLMRDEIWTIGFYLVARMNLVYNVSIQVALRYHSFIVMLPLVVVWMNWMVSRVLSWCWGLFLLCHCVNRKRSRMKTRCLSFTYIYALLIIKFLWLVKLWECDFEYVTISPATIKFVRHGRLGYILHFTWLNLKFSHLTPPLWVYA